MLYIIENDKTLFLLLLYAVRTRVLHKEVWGMQGVGTLKYCNYIMKAVIDRTVEWVSAYIQMVDKYCT